MREWVYALWSSILTAETAVCSGCVCLREERERFAPCFPKRVSPVIYLDNAATTYPKPPQVYSAWTEAMRTYGANPGRGGYDFSALTSEAVFGSRAACAELFGAEPENTVFTLNCTHALNYAIKGLARRRVHFVISDLEHNAVLRPVHSCAAANGGSYSIFTTDDNDDVTLARAERLSVPTLRR